MARRNLKDHYLADMAVLGETPDELPPNLFFTYCGDILGSCGEHYAKGYPISLAQAAKRANINYSDDFAESLAMHQLAKRNWPMDIDGLMASRDEFLDIIRNHYIAYGLQYSPWAAALFEANIPERYAVLLANHDGCGAAMRAAALAPHSHIDEKTLLPFFLITHANAQAIEGAYYVWGMARSLLAGQALKKAFVKGEQAAATGRQLAMAFLERNNLPHVKTTSVVEACRTVLESRDPYINLDDIGAEGIDTHFVVSSAVLILDELQAGQGKEEEATFVVERSLRIGGDPDTICSITMALAGLWKPAILTPQLEKIEITV